MTENHDSKKHSQQPFNLSAHVPPPPPARPVSSVSNTMPNLSDLKKPELRNTIDANTAPPRAVPAPPSRPITDTTPIRPQQVTPTQGFTAPPMRPTDNVPDVTMQIKAAPLNVAKNPMIQPTQIAPSQHEIPKKIEQNPIITPTISPVKSASVEPLHRTKDYHISDEVQLPLIEQPAARPVSPVIQHTSQPSLPERTPEAVAVKTLHVPVLTASVIPPAPARPAVATPPAPPPRPEISVPLAPSAQAKAPSAASSMADALQKNVNVSPAAPLVPSSPPVTKMVEHVTSELRHMQREEAVEATKKMPTIAPPPPPPLPKELQRTQQVINNLTERAAVAADVSQKVTALRASLPKIDVQDKTKGALEQAKEATKNKGKGLFSSLLKKDKPMKLVDAEPLPESRLKSSLLASLESEASKKVTPVSVATIVNAAPLVQQQPVTQADSHEAAEMVDEQLPDMPVMQQPVHEQPAYQEEVKQQQPTLVAETHHEHDVAPLTSEEKEAMARASLPPLPAVPKMLPKRGQSQLQAEPEPLGHAYDTHQYYEDEGAHHTVNYDQFQQPVQQYQPVEGAILPHILTEILRQHKIWLDSEGREGKRANLSSEDLRQADLRGADLRSVNMRGAMLDNLDVRGANFEDADLAEASLRYMHAPKVSFQRANFAGTNCEGAVFDGADLSYSEALSANFAHAHLQGTFMQAVNLRDANFAQANMSYASLVGASCRGVNLSYTLFNHADLTHVDFREAYCLQTQFVNTNLAGTSFKDAHFEEMSFAESDFTQSLDVPIHYQNAGVQQEKVSLQEEKEALKKLESELKKKQSEVTEMKLKMQEQHTMVSSLVADEQRYVKALQILSKRMKIVSIIWFAILAITILATVITVASIPMDDLNMFELSILVIVPLLIFLLCLFSAGLVNSARSKINTHATVRDHKIIDLDKNQ
jgi:uncharacterized protein YjbI with pentapeptide repeats